jgi:hypothetical protein
MHRRLLTLLLALAAGGAAAQAGDPLRTEACRRAVDALDAAQGRPAAAAASTPAASAPAARLPDLRRAAARACLGGSGGVRPLPRQPGTPISVAPVELPRAPLPAALPTPPAMRLPPPPAAPTLVLGCDDAGCWTSDGVLRARAAPGLLFGPRGPCSVQGVVLVCP